MSEVDPREQAEEVLTLPDVIKGKYLVTRVGIPRKEGSDETSALMASVILTSYQENIGDEEIVEWSDPIQTLKASKLEDGQLIIDFPLGVNSLNSVIYAGPYGFKFYDEENEKWFQVSDKKFTKEYFISTYGDKYGTTEEIDQGFIEYLVGMYNFKLQIEFGITKNVEVGMLTDFYRSKGKKKDDGTYGYPRVNKWHKDHDKLDGSHEILGDDVVEAVVNTVEAHFKKDQPDEVPF